MTGFGIHATHEEVSRAVDVVASASYWPLPTETALLRSLPKGRLSMESVRRLEECGRRHEEAGRFLTKLPSLVAAGVALAASLTSIGVASAPQETKDYVFGHMFQIFVGGFCVFSFAVLTLWRGTKCETYARDLSEIARKQS